MRYSPTCANLLHAHSDAPLLRQGIGHVQFARACSFPRDFALTSTSAEHIASSAVTCAAPRSQHCTHKHNKHNPQQTFHRQLCCTTARIITQPRRISTKLREMAIFPRRGRHRSINKRHNRHTHTHTTSAAYIHHSFTTRLRLSGCTARHCSCLQTLHRGFRIDAADRTQAPLRICQ
jgi:hypothetical protein